EAGLWTRCGGEMGKAPRTGCRGWRGVRRPRGGGVARVGGDGGVARKGARGGDGAYRGGVMRGGVWPPVQTPACGRTHRLCRKRGDKPKLPPSASRGAPKR